MGGSLATTWNVREVVWLRQVQGHVIVDEGGMQRMNLAIPAPWTAMLPSASSAPLSVPLGCAEVLCSRHTTPITTQ
jgi:hypothetical protein